MATTPWQRRVSSLALLVAGMACSALAGAQGATPTAAPAPVAQSAWPSWTLGVAPYTYHFSEARQEHAFEPQAQRHSKVWLLSAEKHLDAKSFVGLALFSNSFGQPSQYLYYGQRWEPLDSAPPLFVKLTGGVIHGYREPYHRKIPLNTRSGWGVTVIPAMGWQFSPQWDAQLNVLGSAGLMLQINYTLR